MVTLNRLSVADLDDSSQQLPEAADAATPRPAFHRKKVVPKTDSRDVFLNREENLFFSLMLLIGCYLAILIPAYLPADKVAAIKDDYQQPKDMAVLNRSAFLLAGPCLPRWCLNHLKHLSCPVGLQDIPVFVQQERREPWSLSPPLGFQGIEQHLAVALATLPQPGLPPSLKREGSCTRCVVVGSGGILHGSHLGSHIDQYDIIIRLNNAPVHGFERDVGSRTTIRLTYPEGAPHSSNEYRKTSIFAVVVFKSLDLDWLTSVITKQPLSFWSKMWFWKEVVDHIPLTPESFKIVHPEIIHKMGQVIEKYELNQRNNILPTIGATGVVMALQMCDQVSLAGFGYDMQHPEARLHYYEAIRMDTMKSQVVHDVTAEKLFLKDLVAAGVVTDLTGGV
ncbi:ST3 beta-galactoside alpha-2,3-sialyltransferase 7 [Astatotilapia calliptera]|uniref:Lactosylceramide alpha-2,3-sialyltransferase n=1 Tax=Astatotilapia calliptera TaxID=8154 RepID=A0A3P8PC01_ASTCA|nr:lactosylceramide alpha-2,3-sialyltransferase-like [Astatotilapia calliptera]